MKTSTTISKYAYFLTGTALLFVGWILISAVRDDAFLFPGIGKIMVSFFGFFKDSELLFNGCMSLLRVLVTVLITMIAAFFLSFIYLIGKNLFEIFRPLIFLFKAAPLAIISVYLWISLGSDKAPYLITFLMIFPVAIEGFTTAIDQIPPALSDQMKIEKCSLIRKFFRIYIPLISPYITMIVLQIFGMGIKVMIMGEYLCQTPDSLGQTIYNFKQDLAFDRLLAMLLFIVLIIGALEGAIRLRYKKTK